MTARKTDGLIIGAGAVGAALATVSALLLLAILAGCRPAEGVLILFFYTTVCPSCDASRVAVTQSVRLAGVAKAHPGWRLAVYDVITDDAGLAEMAAAMDRYRIPGEKQLLPMLLVNGTAHSGSGAVETALAALERGGP